VLIRVHSWFFDAVRCAHCPSYKPYVRWIRLGGLCMALGGLLAVTDRRYRTGRRQAGDAPAPDHGGPAGPSPKV